MLVVRCLDARPQWTRVAEGSGENTVCAPNRVFDWNGRYSDQRARYEGGCGGLSDEADRQRQTVCSNPSGTSLRRGAAPGACYSLLGRDAISKPYTARAPSDVA